MLDLRKIGKGDKIIDNIGESFEVIEKTKTHIIVLDKQDRNRKIEIPNQDAKEFGEKLYKEFYL